MTVAAGLGANVLVGGSNRTVALQPLSLQGQVGLNIAAGDRTAGAASGPLITVIPAQAAAWRCRARQRLPRAAHNVAPLDRPRRRLKRWRRATRCRERRVSAGRQSWQQTETTRARAAGPRCVALVGPFQSGKTTLLEAILARTGVIPRQGTVEAGNTVGDASKEARHHRMSVELTVATTNFMGDPYTFLDCPGSVEFVHDMRAVLPAIDVGGGRLRDGREENSAAAAHPARAGRPENSPHSVPQQDRQGRRRRARRAQAAAAAPRAPS